MAQITKRLSWDYIKNVKSRINSRHAITVLSELFGNCIFHLVLFNVVQIPVLGFLHPIII